MYPEVLEGLTQTHDPIVLVSSPAFLGRLKKFPAEPIHKWPVRTVFSSGGPLADQDARHVMELWGRCPKEIYGSTETGGIAWRQRTVGDSEPRWECFPNTSIRCQDGRLWVKSAQTAGHWLETGDRVEMTQSGFQLLGRSDKVIKIEEKRVSLLEMSARLEAHPALGRLKIIPRQHHGRMILAVAAEITNEGEQIIGESGKIALDREMRRYLRDFFPAVVIPRQWHYAKSLPENAQGKIPHSDIEGLFQSKSKDSSNPRSISREQLMPVEGHINKMADRVEIELGFPEQLEYFKGHFPGQPILPGVAQLDWAIQYCDRFFNTGLVVTAIAGLKFHAVIVPGTTLMLCLQWNGERRCCGFSFDGDTRHASGRIQFPGE